MDFRCRFCLREYQAQEHSNFCPFCGRPVSVSPDGVPGAVVVHARDDRGKLSDSMQKKYWKLNQEAFGKALGLLTVRPELPEPPAKRYRKLKIIDFDAAFDEIQASKTSDALFHHIDAFLKELRRGRGESPARPTDSAYRAKLLEILSGYDLPAMLSRINDRAYIMMGFLGVERAECLAPEAIHKPALAGEEIPAEETLGAKELLQEVAKAYELLKKIVTHGGLYAAFPDKEMVDEFDPDRYMDQESLDLQVRQLAEQNSKPYDPLFPEVADAQVLAFWLGLKLLAYATNQMREGPEPDDGEESQIIVEINSRFETAERLCGYWQNKFNAVLDRAYAAGEADMLDLYLNICDVSREVE